MGLLYVVVVERRMGAQQAYSPVWEDRLFYALLPFLAYLALVTAGAVAHWDVGKALFAVSASALLLLFIHNAWDAVTCHVFVVKARQSGRQ